MGEHAHLPFPRKLGRTPWLLHSEVLTLAILAQWPRFRSERDFHRFADVHIRGCFPDLLSHGTSEGVAMIQRTSSAGR